MAQLERCDERRPVVCDIVDREGTACRSKVVRHGFGEPPAVETRKPSACKPAQRLGQTRLLEQTALGGHTSPREKHRRKTRLRLEFAALGCGGNGLAARDRYPVLRVVNRIGEQPLIRTENQPYIHYNKGALALYALRDYIGEDAMNRALGAYLVRTDGGPLWR